jgi:tRNA nucleotidyltransferase (CCA-adding enzyme)
LRGLARVSKDGLEPDAHTKELMSRWSAEVAHLSAERVKEELIKILGGSQAAKALRLARDTGVLAQMMPEFTPCIGKDQESRFHDLSVDEHIFTVLDEACKREAPLVVRLAALFHDIGKPASAWRKDPTRDNSLGDNHLHYYWNKRYPQSKDHARIGAKMTQEVMERLKMYDQECDIKSVVHLVEHHMFTQTSKPIKQRRQVQKLTREQLDNLFLLRKCDRAGKPGGLPIEEEALIDEYHHQLKEQAKNPLTLKDLAIDGNKLLELGYQPGPQLGETLTELLVQVVENPENNTSQWLKDKAQTLAAASLK